MAANRISDPMSPASQQASESTAALIIAAGGARRMGRSKASLPWRGTSLLRRVAEVALASRCRPVHVVLGHQADSLTEELAGLAVEITRNDGWESGIGGSIAAGVAGLPEDCRGVVLLLCDQPFATAELLEALLDARSHRNTPMAACRYGDTLGPPAYFSASLFDRLKSLRGDRGAKSLLLEAPDRVATVDFARGAIDIDTPEDYDRALALLESDDANEGA
jgi:molybdenum cofactor cytidylyltransferase